MKLVRHILRTILFSVQGLPKSVISDSCFRPSQIFNIFLKRFSSFSFFLILNITQLFLYVENIVMVRKWSHYAKCQFKHTIMWFSERTVYRLESVFYVNMSNEQVYDVSKCVAHIRKTLQIKVSTRFSEQFDFHT